MKSAFSWRPFPALLAALLLAPALATSSAHAGLFFQGVAPGSLPWPGGIVPYAFETNVTAGEQSAFLDGLNEWRLGANVRFVPRTNQTQYLLLRYDPAMSGGAVTGSLPRVMIVGDLDRGLLCHETGHVLGFDHEHQRLDRDTYITVNFANIAGFGVTNQEGYASSPYVIATNDVIYGAYDFESVMHYSRRLHALDPDVDVLAPKPPYDLKEYYRLGSLLLSTGDRAAAAYLYGPPVTPLTSVVTNTQDGGFGSLRAAIYYANDHPGTTISFNIPAGDPGHANGVWIIHPTGELPMLVADGTVIDGSTQPGFSGTPVIVLDGSNLIPEAGASSGLQVYAARCAIRNLAFDSFTANGIVLQTPPATNNTVQGCYVGVDSTGTFAAANFEGLQVILGSSGNLIGGGSAGQGNLLSGNIEYGVLLQNTNTTGNVLLGNTIGTDITGTAAIPNGKSGVGIFAGAHANTVGGLAAGSRNLISGNTEYGVLILDPGTSGNRVLGSYLGTDASGTTALPNLKSGVGIFGQATNNTVGGTAAGAGNLLSGNQEYGVLITEPGTTGNTVQGNLVGTDATGISALPNIASGIGIFGGAVGNLAGGTVTGAGNICSGNEGYGVLLADSGTSNNVIQGNLIGTDPSGLHAVPNTYSGLLIANSTQNNQIGGAIPAARNVISGNFTAGVFLTDPGTTGNVIQGNFIGTDITGTNALGNTFVGVYLLAGAQANLVGGAAVGAGNVISGNGSYGLYVRNPSTSSNLVQGNFIGTDLSGSNTLGNGPFGIGLIVFDSASNNVIGLNLDGSGAGNRIAFHALEGVRVADPGTVGNVIRGNNIYSNAGIGINLQGGAEGAGGVTANDLNDADIGPNNLQNFPIVTSAAVAGTLATLTGTLNSTPNHSFLLDFYRSVAADPTGYGQGQFYLGGTNVTTGPDGNAAFRFLSFGAATNQSYTATATDAGTGDTSEFSAAMPSTTVPPPALVGPYAFSGALGFVLNGNVTSGQSYRVQATTNLASPASWLDLTNFIAATGAFHFTNSAATNFPIRFYRLISP